MYLVREYALMLFTTEIGNPPPPTQTTIAVIRVLMFLQEMISVSY